MKATVLEKKKIRREKIKNRAEYFVRFNSTLRATAKVFKVSKSAIHTQFFLELKEIDSELYIQVLTQLAKNKKERAIRGGEATRRKFLLKRMTK